MTAEHAKSANGAEPHAGRRAGAGAHGDRGSYGRLVVMLALSYVSMYALMYAMVNSLDNVYTNINQAYMAGLMTAPMLVIEVALMGAMYGNRKLNAALIAGGLVAMTGLWTLIRVQGGVGDVGFARSMIPHHSGAILMCERASITDPELKALCEAIRASQEAEIEQLERILERLKSK